MIKSFLLVYIFTLSPFFYSFSAAQELKTQKGILIVGTGISGCGKSSTFKELNKLLGGKLFLEPEENEILKEYLDRKSCDDFTLSMGYRSIRVPQLIKAKHLRDSGHIVLVDSYYNKIMSYYMHKKSFDWLIQKNTPYYPYDQENPLNIDEMIANLDCEVAIK